MTPQERIEELRRQIDKLEREIKKEERTYIFGQRFLLDNETEYILAQVDFDKVVLISLKDGNRYTDVLDVEDSLMITEEEFKIICGNSYGQFKLIE